jgi:hypothetical protein
MSKQKTAWPLRKPDGSVILIDLARCSKNLAIVARVMNLGQNDCVFRSIVSGAGIRSRCQQVEIQAQSQHR